MTTVNLLSNITHNDNSTHKMRMVHIRLPEHHVRALKIHAATVDSSVTRLVEAAVQQQYFSDEGNSENAPSIRKTAAEAPAPNSKSRKVNAKAPKAKSPPTKAKPQPTSRRSQPSGVEETKPSDNLALNVVPNPFAAE